MIRHIHPPLVSIAFAALLAAATPSQADTVTFDAFPGPDGRFGTADDVPIGPGGASGIFTPFTNEFVHLAGGVGLVIDSAVGGNPVFGYIGGIGEIYSRLGNHMLVTARPDVAPDAGTFGAVRYRFVLSSDGTTPTTIPSISFNFVPGIAPGHVDTASFFDQAGNLLSSVSYVDGVGSPDVSYGNAAGIARVDITTNFSVATDNISLPAVPEPSVWLCTLFGLPLIARRALVVRRESRDLQAVVQPPRCA